MGRFILPRLHRAQVRARQQTQDDPARVRSVIEEMSTSQLSAFAVFSRTRKFHQGTPVALEGESADGFYILLSGHLAVLIEGNLIAELSEGDVFGEVGLIEGGKRIATVYVMSADAEVLCMSQQNFIALLHTVPAFSFSIHTTASRRATTAPHLGTSIYNMR